MKNLINKLHESRFFGRIFHTVIYCLQKELKDCEAVLDLGCGPSSPLQYSKNIKHSVGVEIFKPYLNESKRRKIHSEYIEQRVEDVDFPENSFDAVIMIEVIEHLPENIGYKMLQRAEKWARKKIIISTPNGYMPQEARDDNLFQKHLSGWELKKMKRLGYQCRGLAGLKLLRQEVPDDLIGDDLTAAIKYRPRIFWFAMATASQLITYYFPSLAFELFCVKKIT